MGKLGCNIDGNLNDQKFSEPLPWIGIYVAAASMACLTAMTADVIHGFRHQKFWFPCKFFSINATSLTLIGVTIKLVVDLNTAMPSRQDQLAKLSSAVFICTVMGNSMPSFGTMGNEEIFMNIMALAILIITIIVNICMQLATGAIFVFWREHASVMFLMLLLLVILTFTALTVPTTKHYLEYKYKKKYELALTEGRDETDKTVACKLRKDLIKYWMMAHTFSPQFVIGRSVTCTASGAFCVLCAMILAEAMLRSYFMPGSFTFCSGNSDYKWSTTLVLITQTIAVGVGTIAPAIRWLIAIRFRCPKRGNISFKRELFYVESYWIQRLSEMKEYPLTARIFKLRSRYFRRGAHTAKVQFLNLCIALQTWIVVMCKVVRYTSIFFVSQVLLCYDCCRELKEKFKFNNSISSNYPGPDSQPESNSNLDLSRFVLHLEGEDALVGLMMRSNIDATDNWLKKGKKREPKYLTKLLENSSKWFRGVAEFDSDQVPSLVCEEPPNCWALPVVTLTSIALALPDIKPSLRKDLICSVYEGLMYVIHIEKILAKSAKLANIKKAAELVWTGVDLYHRWLDVDLHKLSLQGKSPKETLEELAETAKNKFLEQIDKDTKACLKETLKWPTKVLAANSMYRISCTILLEHESRSQTGEKLFEAVSVMISDILGACLTNFHQVLCIKVLSTAIEEREELVRHAVFVLGKTEKILEILSNKALPSLEPHQMMFIDAWRLSLKQNSPWDFTKSSSEEKTLSSCSNDVYRAIDYNLDCLELTAEFMTSMFVKH